MQLAPRTDDLPVDLAGQQSATARLPGWALATAACLIYAAIRAVSIGTAAYRVSRGPVAHWDFTLPQLLGSWDANRYQIIAAHGYSYFLGNRPHNSLFAWFPGYPAAIHVFAWIPRVGYPGAAFGVAMAAGLVAACGLARLVADVTGDRRAALLTVAFWAAAPGSLALNLEYPEPLFCALAAWALVFLVRRRWLLAGGIAALAGTVHPLAAVALAPLGLLSYWGYTGWSWGTPTAWFTLEHDMHNGFDWGRNIASEVSRLSSIAALAIASTWYGLYIMNAGPWAP